MTGYTVHTGASKKFVSGWDRIFSDGEEENKETDKDKKPAKTVKKSKAKKVKKS